MFARSSGRALLHVLVALVLLGAYPVRAAAIDLEYKRSVAGGAVLFSPDDTLRSYSRCASAQGCEWPGARSKWPGASGKPVAP